MVVSMKSARSDADLTGIDDPVTLSPFEKATTNTVHSKYFYAMLVYLINAIAMLANDGVGGVDAKNEVYFVFAIIHLVNAIQFCVVLGYEKMVGIRACAGVSEYYRSFSIYLE
jgi:hypothetical protein